MAGPLGLGRKLEDWKHLSRILFFYPKCMCVCIYVCIHVFLCIHVYMGTCTCMCICMCTCIFMCMHALYTCMCTCMYSACINVCMRMCVVYMCAYMYMRVHIEIRGQPQRSPVCFGDKVSAACDSLIRLAWLARETQEFSCLHPVQELQTCTRMTTFHVCAGDWTHTCIASFAERAHVPAPSPCLKLF